MAASFPEVGPFRLPHTFEPSRYRARLALKDERFDGHIEIDGELSDEVSLIWLHGVDLVVTRATATRGDTTVDLQFSAPRTDQLLGLSATSPLPAGRWTLSLDYSGPIREQQPQIKNPWGGGGGMRVDAPGIGVFRRQVGASTYVFTQSEAIYARRIFPCVDEPARKVPWQLSIEVDKDLVAASNTAIVREVSLDHDRKLVEFAETRPLPTYLIAFAVGPFEIVQAPKPKSGTPIRILAVRGQGAAAAISAAAATRILDALESWTALPYPYGKLDLVTVPYLGLGAMENPGLITFNGGVLKTKAGASTIAHEFAHQWFGNLVTLAWWDDIWLNESFAELMEDKLDALLGQRPSPERIAQARVEAMAALSNGIKVHRDVKSLDDVEITKLSRPGQNTRGTALLTLIEQHLGPQVFQKAIRRYLADHAHGSVTTSDLVRALGTAGGKTFETTLASLVDGSLPSLTPTLVCDEHPHVRFTNIAHPVEVCIAYDRTGKRADLCRLLDESSQDVPLAGTSCPRWLMPDASAAGLYRIEWTKPLVDDLLANGWSSLTLPERLALFGQLENFDLKLSTFVLLAASGMTAPGETLFLSSIARFVTPDLRSRFDAWIQAHYGARARSVHFSSGDLEAGRDGFEQLQIVDLVASTLDAQLSAEATQLAANQSKAPLDEWFAAIVLGLAANADPKVLDSLFADLAPRRDSDRMRQQIALAALAHVRNLVSAFKADPKKLDHVQGFEAIQLFHNVCDPADRQVLAELFDKYPPFRFEKVLPMIDLCIAARARLEPLFRRLLKATP